MTSQRFSIARWAPTSPRSMFVFAFDLAAVACAWLGAFLLRFNLAVPEDYLVLAMRSLVWVVPIWVPPDSMSHRPNCRSQVPV